MGTAAHDPRFPILVVDDEPLVVRALRRPIEDVCPSLGASSLGAAHEQLDQPLAGLVLDVHVGGGFGWEILAVARAHDPLLPAMVITGRAWSTFEEQARASYALVRHKPIEPEDVRRFARWACARRTQGRSIVAGLVREVASWARLTPREVAFVDALVLGAERVDDPHHHIEAMVLAKTGKANPNALRSAVLWAFFRQDAPFL